VQEALEDPRRTEPMVEKMVALEKTTTLRIL